MPVNAGQRVLPIVELTPCKAGLDSRPTDIALKVALLSGEQQIQQLLKSAAAGWDQDSATLLLYDDKGKRTIPGKHLPPLANGLFNFPGPILLLA